MKAVAYVSGIQLLSPSDTPRDQLTRIADFASEHLIEIRKRFQDASSGHGSPGGSVWRETLYYCRAKRVPAILIDSFDRLSTQASVACDMIDECQSQGTSLIDCSRNMELTVDEPDRWLAIAMMIVVSEFNRRVAARKSQVAQ